MTSPDELRIADDLFLIALDDRTGRHLVEARMLGIGLAGALLIEMLIDGTIQLVNERLRPTGTVPPDAVTHRVLAHIQSEPHHDIGTWLAFIGRTSAEDVGERLQLQRLLRKTETRRLLGGSSVLYQPISDKTAAAVAWRPMRLAMKLGAGAHFERGIKTLSEAALVVLCHAIGLTQRVLRDGGPPSYAYLGEIHQELARSYPAMHQLAARVGELVGAATFTRT